MNAERRAEYEKTLVECCELANQISDELDVLLRLMGGVQEFIEAHKEQAARSAGVIAPIE